MTNYYCFYKDDPTEGFWVQCNESEACQAIRDGIQVNLGGEPHRDGDKMSSVGDVIYSWVDPIDGSFMEIFCVKEKDV